ncbi:hypothetical protein BgiMline_026365, partial [Biomphalaria glabrata]
LTMRDASKTKGLITITLLCCLFIYLLPNFDVLPDRRVPRDEATDTKLHCVLPKPVPTNHNVVVVTAPPKQKSNKSQPEVSFSVDENLTLSVAAPGSEFACVYQLILWSHDKFRFQLGPWSENFTQTVQLPNEAEHVRLFCTDKASHPLADYLFEVTPKRKVLEIRNYKDALSDKMTTRISAQNSSVLLILVNGLRQLDFVSSMKRTYGVLMTELQSIGMNYHSQHVFTKFYNMFPILKGRPARTARTSSPNKTEAANEFIWEKFSRQGYVTFSSEDSPEDGTLSFNLSRSRFPDFTSAPLVTAYNFLKSKVPSVKSALRPESWLRNFHLENVKMLFDLFPERPIFSFVHFSRRRRSSQGTTLDDELSTFLSSMKSSGHLDNTLVFLLSDSSKYHLVEQPRSLHVLPLYIYLPSTFVREFPDLVQNLKDNADTITTHFDLYVTLVELSGQQDNNVSVLAQGQSLFQKIPFHRSCGKVLVHSLLCSCQTSV